MSPAVPFQRIMSLEAIFFASATLKIRSIVNVLLTVAVSAIVNVNGSSNDNMDYRNILS